MLYINGLWPKEMKFQKGLLDDLKKPDVYIDSGSETGKGRPAIEKPNADDGQLFHTHKQAVRAGKQYVRLLAAVSFLVAIIAVVAFYLTLPRRGDQVRAPRGLETAIRSHFVDVEKRATGDIAFYLCEDYYWARVEVEKRPDIKSNPIYQIGTYTARAVGNSESGWQITAAPITEPRDDTPCP